MTNTDIVQRTDVAFVGPTTDVVREAERTAAKVQALSVALYSGVVTGAVVLRTRPRFLCAPQLLAGGMTLSDLTQAAAAFTLVQGSFNWLVYNFNRVADWVSSLENLKGWGLLRSLDRLNQGKPPTREKTPIAAGSVTTPL